MTDFDLVWAEYPRKTNKAYARQCWNKLAPDTEMVQAMLDALVWQKNTEQWRRNVIPHMSTWLNKRRFEDEAPACHCRPQPTGEVLELAKSIARGHAAQAEADRAKVRQREVELMAQGRTHEQAVFQASQEWLRTHR